MTTTRTIITTFAAVGVAALVLSAAPANAAGFTLHLGGPIPFTDMTDGPELGKPQVHFDVRLGGPDITDEAPLPAPMTKADFEQAQHQCVVLKKMTEVLDLMNENLKGYQRIGDKQGVKSQLEEIAVWKARIEITKRDCYKIYV